MAYRYYTALDGSRHLCHSWLDDFKQLGKDVKPTGIIKPITDFANNHIKTWNISIDFTNLEDYDTGNTSDPKFHVRAVSVRNGSYSTSRDIETRKDAKDFVQSLKDLDELIDNKNKIPLTSTRVKRRN